ncbi:MAG: hypothetical protein U0797_29415 [Gemmataceae bacterium]
MSARKRRYLLGGLLVVLLLFLTWLAWPDPRMARAAELRQGLFGPAGKALSDQERRQRFQEYRELTKGLSPAQRRQLSSESRRDKQREIARYLALSQAEKTRYLDNEIRRQQARQSRGPAAGGGGQPKGGLAKGGQAKGGQGKGGNGSPQERDRRRQSFLDGSTAAERGLMTRFQRDLNARRAQLGLPPRGGR